MIDPMNIQSSIQEKLKNLVPVHTDVINESFMHNVPEGSETHFKVTVVSEKFQGKLPVARHRMVHALLADEIAGPVHALSLYAMTPEEWFEKGGQVPDSPACRGGGQGTGSKPPPSGNTR